MKQTFAFMWIVILSAIQLYAQNLIDPPTLPINFNNTAVFDRNYASSHFILGWNWGSPGRRLDDALSVNYYHRGYDTRWDTKTTLTSSSLYAANHRQMMQFPWLVDGYGSDKLFNAQSVNLIPVISPDSTNNFKPRAYDSSGSVFGFYYKSKVRILDSSQHANANYRFLLLDKDSVSSTAITVLKNAWNLNELHYLNYDTASVSHSSYNGINFYLTINLKSRDTIPASFKDSVILRIKLPYVLNNGSTGYIKFDSLASASLDSIANVDTLYNQDRGRYKKLSGTNPASKPTEFAITGEMLKYSTANPADSSLTLSAYFICNGTDTTQWNSFLYAEGTGIANYIKNLDVEVVYAGKINLSVRYIRVECPRAQAMFRGYYDNFVKKETDTLSNLISSNGNGVHIHRIYGDDEVFPRGWAAMRYFNMLLDTMVSLETFTWANWGSGVHLNKPLQYLYSTSIKEFDCGSTLVPHNEISTPYYKRGKVQYSNNQLYANTFYMRAGRNGFYLIGAPDTNKVFSDSLKSNYETWLVGPNKTSMSGYSTVDYDSIYCSTCSNYNLFYSYQNFMEYELYNGVYKYQPLIYGNKPFWANMWVAPYSIYDTLSNTFNFGGTRPETGEEIRFSINSSLSLGAKGLLYWFKTSEGDIDKTVSLGLAANAIQYPSLTGDNLIYSDTIGGDYIKFPDPNKLDSVFHSGNYDFNTLGVDSNHIYVGMKSTRAEINKIHKFIKNNEQTLMNLRLVSWYGKGFIKMYSQHSKYTATSDTIMKYFIDYRNIKTRPIGRVDHGSPYYEQATSIDSGFYDITLHRDIVNDSNMTSSFTLCIVNRRTDPLVPIDSTNKLDFYSTAEFDKFTQDSGRTLSGQMKDTTFWREKFWKRLACREIRIPLKYRNPADTSQDYILTVKELTDSSAFNSNWWWYRKEKWNRKIDTVLGRNETLVANYLPGEARWFKVNVTPKPKFSGKLAYSAQNKMVVYPSVQTSSSDFRYKDTSNYYHIVYQKWEPAKQTYNIFYRRSVLTYPNDKATNIIWGPEYRVSKWHKISKDLEPQQTPPFDYDSARAQVYCEFPTIAIRFDSALNMPMAYVLYNVTRKLSVDTPKVFIVENVFPANWIGIPSIPDTATAIAYAYSNSDLPPAQQRWGVPTINASYYGNFYSWADYLGGIVVGWKHPHDRGLIKVRGGFKNTIDRPVQVHPNLNTYSRMNIKENNCAIVWQAELTNGTSQIYYSRIKLVDSVIKPFIRQSPCDPIPQFNSAVRLDTLAHIEFYAGNIHPCFPVVTRSVAYKLRSCCANDDSIHYATAAWDRVSWMEVDSVTTTPSLYLKGIDIDDIATDTCMNFLPTSRITSTTGKLYYPFLTSGNISRTDSAFHEMVGKDSAMILLFTEKETGSGTNTVYQYNHDFWYPYQIPPTYAWGSVNWQLHSTINQNYLHKLGTGIYPHAASLPVSNNQTDFWMVKSVYQTLDSNIIGATQAASYKEAIPQEKAAVQFIGFTSKDSLNSSALTSFVFDDGRSLPIKFGETDVNNKPRFYDTLITDWFRIGSLDKLGFNYFSAKNDAMKICLQRQKDGKIFNINQSSTLRQVNRNKVTLLNGKGDNYRILIIKTDSSCVLDRTTVLGYTNEFIDEYSMNDDNLLKASDSYSTSTILLNSDTDISNGINLNIYPNPARDVIYVKADLPSGILANVPKSYVTSHVSYKLFNSLGMELASYTGNSGETIEIPTTGYSGGVYFIRAEIESNYYNKYDAAPAIQMIVIKR